MQRLQRLFKVTQQKQSVSLDSTTNRKEIAHHVGEEEIIPYSEKARRRSTKGKRIDLDCNDLNKHLASLLRRENLKACFSNTLYLYSVKIKKEDIVKGLDRSRKGHSKPGYVDQSASSPPAATHHVRSKVLPVSDTSPTSSTRRQKQNDNGGRPKGDEKNKGVSKMKELLRWSAAAKSQKGGKHNGIKFQVSHFRIRESVKGLPSGGDGEPKTESPKISFQVSTISASPVPCCSNTDGLDNCHCCTKEGNWITTDDEFVVLEL